jgi:hypothetical protein
MFNGKLVIFVSGKLPIDVAQRLNAVFGKLPLQAPKERLLIFL